MFFFVFILLQVAEVLRMMSADDEDAEIGPEDLDRYEKRPNTPPLRFQVELLSSERKRISLSLSLSQAFAKICQDLPR